jgi:hypothetical protein
MMPALNRDKIHDAKRAKMIVSQIKSSRVAVNSSRGLNGKIRLLFDEYFSLSDEFRFYVMHSISTSKNWLTRRLLYEILDKDKSLLVRHEAAFALGCIGNRTDIPRIVRALHNDDDSLVRHEAAMALGACGMKQDIPALKKGIRDPDPMVGESCRAAIELVKLRCERQ